jgi:membrane-associated phospholipid phosphatase
VMSEAMAQRSNPWAYYRGILMCDSWSAPYTRDLVEVATRVGQFQAMHYKRRFNRPRPSQISPILLPPIDVPGHASYPSGHATESHLISLCLAQVMPAAAHRPPPPRQLPAPRPPQVKPIPPWSPLERMAQRIARNREVMGLHYPSDSRAGKLLAEQSFKLLMRCNSIRHPTNGLLALARREWRA